MPRYDREYEYIEGVPVICFDCDYCEVRGHYLYCHKEEKTVYVASRPKWCPLKRWRNIKTGEEICDLF